MLLLLRAEAQAVHQLQRVAQTVAAGELVADLAEDLADFVFDGVGVGGAFLESLQIGEQFIVDEQDQIVAGERAVVVEAAVGLLRRGPARPAEFLVDEKVVGLAHQLGLHGPFPLQVVQILEEQHPRGLLGIVQLGGATGLLPKHIVDVAESLFEHA